MKKIYLFLIGAVVLVGVVIMVLLLMPSKVPQSSQTTTIDEIEQLVHANKVDQAKSVIKEIDPFHMQDPEFLLRLARLHIQMRELADASAFAEQAWDNGGKNRSTIDLLLFANQRLGKELLFSYISRFLDELPEDSENSNFIAGVYQDLGYPAEAQKIWLRYFEQKNNSPLERAEYALKVAKSLVLGNDLQGAVGVMEKALDEDCMNLQSFNFYISLCLMIGDYQKGTDLFYLAEKKYSSPELLLKRGLAYIYQAKMDEAKDWLKLLYSPNTSSISSLAVNYNARMYLALTRFLKIEEGDLVSLSDLIQNSKDSIGYLNSNSGSSRLLKLSISPDILEKESVFYEALSQLLEDEVNGAEFFTSKSSLFPEHPVVDFVVLKAGAAHNSNVSAVTSTSLLLKTNKLSLIEGLHGLFIMSPPCITEISRVLYRLGAYEQAVGFIQTVIERKELTAAEINLLLKLALKTENEELLNNLLELKNINEFVDLDVLQEVAKKPGLADKLFGNDIFRVIFLANSNKTEEALKLCEKLQLPAPKDALLRALIHTSSGDVVKADEFYRQSLEAGSNFWGYREYAGFLTEQGRREEAKAIYKKILSAVPADPAAVTGLVNLMELEGETDKALEFLETKLDSQDVAVLLKLAKLSIKKQNFPLALRYSNKIIRALGKNDEAIFYKTIALVGIVQQYPTQQNKQALKKMSLFIQGILEKDHNQLVLVAYLESLYALQEYDLFLRSFKELDGGPEGGILEKQILAFIRTGNLTAAQELLDKSKSRLTNDAFVFAQAELNGAKGDHGSSVPLLRKSENRNLRYKAAEFAVRENKVDEALEIMKTISPTFIDWVRLAATGNSVPNVEFAFRCYDQALELAPDNPLVLNNYAWLGAETGKLDKQKAVAMITTAYSTTPTDTILDTYLFVLDKSQMYDEGLNLIKKNKLLTELSPQTAALYLSMMKKRGKPEAILEILEEILKRDELFWKEFTLDRESVKKEYLRLRI